MDALTIIASGQNSTVESQAGEENLTFYPRGGKMKVSFYAVITSFTGGGTLRVSLQHSFVGGVRVIGVANRQNITTTGTHLIPMTATFDGSNAGRKVAIPHITRIFLGEHLGVNPITITGKIFAVFGD